LIGKLIALSFYDDVTMQKNVGQLEVLSRGESYCSHYSHGSKENNVEPKSRIGVGLPATTPP
jgi:hypothetical protein